MKKKTYRVDWSWIPGDATIEHLGGDKFVAHMPANDLSGRKPHEVYWRDEDRAEAVNRLKQHARPHEGGKPLHSKKSPAQLEREIKAALAKPTSDADLPFYLTDINTRQLELRFATRGGAKRAALKLVRDGAYPVVEVWHLFNGGRYMQGLANEGGWSDV
jgi:hypothetical protein